MLDELERAGYLSDARFASAVVRQKAGGYSKRAIAHALREKGVAAPAAQEALAALDGDDEFAQALALWRRRFGKAPADEREKARQVRFLVSRGYATSVVFRVLRASGGSGRRRLISRAEGPPCGGQRGSGPRGAAQRASRKIMFFHRFGPARRRSANPRALESA